MATNWDGEKRLYEKQFYAVTRRKTRIIDIPKGSDDIGFTSKNGDIHLAQENEIIKGLGSEKKAAFRMGVFTHEMLHQVYTSFSHLEDVVNRFKDPVEKQITSLFANLVEDPAIEYFAPLVVGGEMLEALRFTISWVYDKSQDISESKSPFTQLLNALIQFGDMGLIKGEFTFPEARAMFTQLLPEFNATVLEKDPEVRINRAAKWMVMTKPLWRKEIQTPDEAKELQQEMEGRMSGEMQGEGQPMQIPDSDPKGTEASERRSAVSDKVQKQQQKGESGASQKETGTQSGNTSETPSEGSDFNESESRPDSGSSSGNESKDESSSDDRKTSGKSGSSAEESDEEDEDFGMGEDADGMKGEEKSEKGSQDAKSGDADDNEDFADASAKSEEEGEGENESASEKDGETETKRESIEDILNRYRDASPKKPKISKDTLITIWQRISEERELEGKKENEKFVDHKIQIPQCKNIAETGEVKCLNVIEEPGVQDADAYAKIVEKNRHAIKLLTASLKTIIRNDYDQMLKNTSGKYNIKRDLTHTSVKVFDKRKERKNVDDLSVFLLVDNSGSMSGGKIVMAKDTSAILAEVFANLKIPCYIMGFTADSGKADVEQHHFVSWKNTRAERTTIARMQARVCNDDGYSIRYATQMLMNHHSEHKLLFVISDGAPSARRYTQTNGIADTGLAVREAAKKFPVLGLGIGNGFLDEAQMKEMYKGAFIQVRDLEKLPVQLAKHLKKLIRK